MRNSKIDVKDISLNYYKYLFGLENVTGLGFGYKYIKNIGTKEPCIHVLVEKKVESKYLTANNIIPKYYMGIKTDVINVGKIKLKKGEAIPEKIRPLEGGCGISLKDAQGDGTLGCIVKKVKEEKVEYFILSNNHVIAGFNRAPIGTPIVQPSEYLGGKFEEDIIANLSNFIPVRIVTPNKEPVNQVDCAIAKINNTSINPSNIIKLQKIKGVDEISIDDNIKKVGFTSGLTEGTVNTIDATIKVNFNGSPCIFIEQIVGEIENKSGDSGSIVVNENNSVVGLFFGGTNDDKFAFINKIQQVLNKLKVELCFD